MFYQALSLRTTQKGTKVITLMSVGKRGPEIGPDTKRRAFKLERYVHIVLLRP